MNDIWIEKFNTEILPVLVKNYNPSKVLIFGSRAKGYVTENSDIDVIIVSNIFKDIPFIKRMGNIIKMARFPKHVDYLCYTPEEFENVKNTSSILDNALTNFVELV